MSPLIVWLRYHCGLGVKETYCEPAAFRSTAIQPVIMLNLPDDSGVYFPISQWADSSFPQEPSRARDNCWTWVWCLFSERHKQTFTIYGSVSRIYLSRRSDIQRWSNWHFSWARELGPAQRQANSFSKGHRVGCWWSVVERYFRVGQGHNQRGLWSTNNPLHWKQGATPWLWLCLRRWWWPWSPAVSSGRMAWLWPAQRLVSSGWENGIHGTDASKVGETGMFPSFGLK